MTNDYKENILDYVTGNLEVGTSQSNSFKDTQTITNNLYIELNNLNIVPQYYQVLYTESSSNLFVYGGYLNDDDNTYYGFIAILNANGEVLDILTEYDSGTKFSYFQRLEYDEDNNIYGIDLVGDRYRFIMLNNVAIETSSGFSCKLRQSYYIPSEANYKVPDSYLQGTSYVKKSKGEAVYYIFGSNNTNVMLIKFTINVGSTNEWLYYTGSSLEGYNINFSDFVLEKVNDTTEAYIYYVLRNIVVYCDYFDGSTLTRQTSITFDTNTITDIRMLNSQQCYVGVEKYVSDDDTYDMQIHIIENGASSLLQTINVFELFDFYFSLIDGLLFTKLSGGYTSPAPSSIGMYYAKYGVYDGNNYIESNPISILWNLPYLIDYGCIVQKSYALYKCFVQLYNTLYTLPVVIYDNQYSGASYINYNSLVPLHSELYSNGNIVFARSLYNKSLLNNITTSTTEVPYNYLNGIDITKQDLLSETQLPIVNSTNTINKNIYENLFINFINTINVIDEDENKNLPLSATYINQNINVGTQSNYEESYLSKIRLNTSNGSTIKTIPWDSIDNTHFETNFSIYIDSSPISIEFISSNEEFVYLTKDISNFEVGNIYTIGQKIRIE